MKFSTTKIVVPIDKIAPNPWNPNYQTAAQFKFQKESIERDGFIGSIFVRQIAEDVYQILDGEHRWKAAKELGYMELPAENIGFIPDPLAQVFTIKMNKGGQDDPFKVGKILAEMKDEFQAMLPFTQDQIENTQKLVTFDFSQYEKESELPERNPGMLIVLPFSSEESFVWLKAKEELVARNTITTDNTKKKQDIQMVMWLIKAFMNIVKSDKMEGEIMSVEVTSEDEKMVNAEKVQLG